MEPRMCNKCGSPIPYQRLEALPDTRCCVGCSCVKCRTVLDIEVDGPEIADLVQATQGVPRGE